MLTPIDIFRSDCFSGCRSLAQDGEFAYDRVLTQADISWKFLFGDWCLYTQTFPALVVSEHFTKLPVHPPQTKTIDNWRRGSEVIFMPSHPIRETLSRVELTKNTIRYVPGQYRRYYIDIQGSFSEYLGRLPSKERLELRRKRRRFAESSGGVQYYREYRLPGEMTEFYELSREISKRSFQGKLGVGIPNSEKFRSDLVRLAGEGRVRGFLLLHRGCPVAYEYCRVYGDCLTGELCGYDPEMRRSSPGSVLMFCILEQLFREQIFQYWDFGTGEAKYKAFLSTGSRTCADVYYLSRNIKNSGIIAAHCALRAAWWCTGATLDMMRLRSRLRKMLRTREKERSSAD